MNKATLRQLGWFAGIGILNTGVDFLILNILVLIAGEVSSIVYLVFRCIAFLSANANSYFLNTRFTFQTGRSAASYGSFFVATLVGLGCNALVSFVCFLLVSGHMSQALAVNGSALVGTLASMVVNFILYKYVVFSTPSKDPSMDTSAGK